MQTTTLGVSSLADIRAAMDETLTVVRARHRLPSLSRHLESFGPIDPSAMSEREARRIANAFYREVGGRKRAPARFLSQTGKLIGSETYATGLQLRPGDASGVWETCVWRSLGCTAACVLETSFRGKSDAVRDGRTMRTLFLAAHPQAMVTLIARELRLLVSRYGRVLFRPNIASDLRWEYIAPALFAIAGVIGYDYTKADPMRHRGTLDNYRLCYSVSEMPQSESIARRYVAAGGTAAVVVRARKHAVPSTWWDAPAVDGDLSDDRASDPRGVYVMLAAKADGKRDATGFVREMSAA